jgi:peptidoglycan/LPS O-acetylase OafA/YrhL
LNTFPSHPKYRPDIDGLRALAVFSVVMFHAFPDVLRGGFIGVDVFFVISGYLISSIIFNGLGQGRFSFSEFYIRRIKRIFPALLLVLMVCFAFSWFFLLSEEFKQFGKHMIAGSVFVSNFVLWGESGYFDNAAETKPLLHLWSLGVEEQFYILWPVLLCVCWKSKFRPLFMIVALLCLSFFLNMHGVRQDPISTFYLPQTRFWELLSGSLLAWFHVQGKGFDLQLVEKLNTFHVKVLGANRRVVSKEVILNLLAWLGAFLLAYGFFRVNKELKFPGKWALVPVLGAVFLITSGPHSWFNRKVLSNKVLVWFGLISFPLYLWHWPLLSFARIVLGEVPSSTVRLLIVGSSVFLAWLTFRFVERPIRFGSSRGFKIPVLVGLMVLAGGLGFFTYTQDGFGFRKHAQLDVRYQGDIGHLEYHKFIAEHHFLCTPKQLADEAPVWDGFVRCMQSKPVQKVDMALLGDSHAEHLFLGMADALPTKNLVFYIQSSPPFVDNPAFQHIFKALVESPSIKQVFLAMHWIERYSAVPKGSSLEAELIKVVDMLHASGKSVYLTDDIPRFSAEPLSCKGVRWPNVYRHEQCQLPLIEANQQKLLYMKALNKVAIERPSVKVLNIGHYLCDDQACSMTKSGDILYRDTNHLNLKGSMYVGRRLVEENALLFF